MKIPSFQDRAEKLKARLREKYKKGGTKRIEG